MYVPTILETYAREATARAQIAPLEDGSYVGEVPGLVGVFAYAATEAECAVELFTVVKDRAKFRIERGRHVPMVGDIDLNTEENRRLVTEHS